MFEVYVITNIINNKKYVGFTSEGHLKRFKNHLKEARHGGNRLLCKAIRKHGKDNFSVELLEVVGSHKDAIRREQELIMEHKTFAGDEDGWGYNTTRGGEGSIGHEVSPELRAKLKLMREDEGRWKGDKNPNYKNKLFNNSVHARRGVKISEEGKRKLREANSGRFVGTKHHNAVRVTTYAKKMDTGEIIKRDSFYELRTFLEETYEVKINRSSALKVMRGESRSHNGFVFYREDETPKEIINNIEREYIDGIKNPIILESLNQKETHPNAKNFISFARCVNTGELLKFNSWYECKRYMCGINPKFTYSEMKKCLEGKRKNVRGYIFYREDITDAYIFEGLKDEYRSFNDYRKHT